MDSRGISKAARGAVGTLLACLALLAVPAIASADGSISGLVTRVSDGATVTGAEVCATATGGGSSLCSQTVPAGTYEIPGLAPGTYRVAFSAGSSGQDLVGQSVTADVEEGLATENVDAALRATGRIRGAVTLLGAPLQGVNACALAPGFEQCAITGSNGSYELAGLAAGSYGVKFAKDGLPSQFYPGGRQAAEAGVAAVGEGAVTTGVDAAFGQIRGHVYASDGLTPVKGALVCAIDPVAVRLEACGSSNAAGAYAISLVPGSYTVGFSLEWSEFGFAAAQAGELGGPDGWRSQFWNLKPTTGKADVVSVPVGSPLLGIDARLEAGSGGESVTGAISPVTSSTSLPPITATPSLALKRKPVRCKKGFRRVKKAGKTRCVRVHHHKRKHAKKKKKH